MYIIYAVIVTVVNQTSGYPTILYVHFVQYAANVQCLNVRMSWLKSYSKSPTYFLSASLYFSKRGAYWDRLCRDVVGRWLSRACTVAKRCILGLYSYYGTLIGNPTPGIQWYNLRPPGVTPNRGMGPPWGAFCQITLTSCFSTNERLMYMYYKNCNYFFIKQLFL